MDDAKEQEQVILSRFNAEVAPDFPAIESAELVGSYPETVIRVTATRGDQTHTAEWSIWDGNMTGSPPGSTGGTGEYLTLLVAETAEWLSAPFWRS